MNSTFQAEYCGDPDDALDTYDKVLALDPSKLIALNGKASLLAQVCPVSVYALILIANGVSKVHVRMTPDETPEQSCGDDGQSPEALAVKRLYKDIVRQHPGSPEAHMGYAWFEHQVTKSMEQAKVLYRTAISLDPSQVPALCNLATILHFEDRDLSAAEEVYNSTLEKKFIQQA